MSPRLGMTPSPMVDRILGCLGTYPRHAWMPGTGCTPNCLLFPPFLSNFPHFPPSFPMLPHFSTFPIFPAVHHGYVSGYIIRNCAGYIPILQLLPLFTNTQGQHHKWTNVRHSCAKHYLRIPRPS